MTFLSQVINLNFSTRLQASGAHVVSDHSLIFYQGRRRRSRRSDDDGGAREVAGGCAASQPRKKRTKAAREGGALCRLCDMPTSPRAQQRQQGRSMGRRGRVSIVLCTVDSPLYSIARPPSNTHCKCKRLSSAALLLTVIGLGLCTDLSFFLMFLSTKTATCFHSTF